VEKTLRSSFLLQISNSSPVLCSEVFSTSDPQSSTDETANLPDKTASESN
jgi:hypothetical protein